MSKAYLTRPLSRNSAFMLFHELLTRRRHLLAPNERPAATRSEPMVVIAPRAPETNPPAPAREPASRTIEKATGRTAKHTTERPQRRRTPHRDTTDQFRPRWPLM